MIDFPLAWMFLVKRKCFLIKNKWNNVIFFLIKIYIARYLGLSNY